MKGKGGWREEAKGIKSRRKRREDNRGETRRK